MLNKKAGRPRKNVNNSNVTFTVNTVKMNDLSFNDNLFNPMKTKTRVDQFFSNEGGIMPGVNYVGTGDPGVGKTTVLLDILADVKNSGKKCLFISGEMNAIDMVGYVKRFPKFGDLDILFMGDYSEVNPDVVLRTALKEGYDLVLIDSMAEVADMYTDYFGGTNKSNQGKLLQLFEEHNLGNNDAKLNSAFLIIQQVTKSGGFAGSNKLKHMTTGMLHMRMSDEGRYLHFSKNRRGGNGNKLFFSLSGRGKVEYLHEEPINQID
jgi:DNA repair protein RadA/Sms|tara:strand:- start:2117 stop:2908 length:792 start_codon:yes stop_codon:yes gene_type:complete